MTGHTLSCNVKVRCILRRAIANLENLRTLYIILGHAHITNALLHGFFDPKRTKKTPVRRLWIESSHLCGARPHLDFNGLESLRLRRLRLDREENLSTDSFVLSRGGIKLVIPEWEQDTTIKRSSFVQVWGDRFGETVGEETCFERVNAWDDAILKKFPEFESLYQATKPAQLSEWAHINPPIDENHGQIFYYTMIPSSSATLTSLCLDWCFGISRSFQESIILDSITFPKLRALQIRNASMAETLLRDDSFLFEGFWVDFLARHSSIQCLAWPAEHWFSTAPKNTEILHLIDVLGRGLKVLRVDAGIISNLHKKLYKI